MTGNRMTGDRVLIAGAGPVGLVAAAALSDAGIPVLVVEAERDLPDGLRASTFHPPTLDMLEQFGVVGAMLAQGLICPTWQYRDRAHGVIATFDLSLLAGDTGHPYRLQCEQWRLTRLLRDQLPADAFLYDARAVDVAQDEAGVTLTVERPDGAREALRGRFLIGADGARSAVRRAAGIDFPGLTIPELFLTLSTSFAFHEAIPDLANIAYVSDPEEWFVLLRTAGMWRVLLPTDPTLTDDAMLADAAIETRMQGVLTTSAPYEIRHRTAYRVHERVAEHYVAGRVALAGDAAHVNNPLGGMGMNGGIHDAFALAASLVRVFQDGDETALPRYERQRRKVAIETVQAQALRNRATLNQRDPAARAAHQAELRAIAADPEKHRAFLLRSSLIQSLRELEAVA